MKKIFYFLIMMVNVLFIHNATAGMTVTNHIEDEDGWLTLKIYEKVKGNFPGSCGYLINEEPDFTQYINWGKTAAISEHAPDDICLIIEHEYYPFSTSPLSNNESCILEIIDMEYGFDSRARATLSCQYQNKCADGKYYFKEHDWRKPGSHAYKEAFENCYPTRCVEDPSLPFCLPSACRGDDRCVRDR